MKFTKSAVGKLALPERRSEIIVFDDALPGFGLRIRAGGKRVWIAQYRVGTRQRRVTIGSDRVLDLDEARQQARTVLAQVHLGTDPQAQRATAKAAAAVTFGSVLPRYLARVEGRQRASSYGDTRRYLDVRCKALHELPLTDIRRANVADCLGTIAIGKGNKQATPYAADRARAALSAFFAWAVGEGLVEANPVIGTNKAATDKARDRVLSDAELVALWRAVEGSQIAPVLRLLALTGQRREEVAGLRWSELDLQGAVWRLPSERTKNRRSHDVPLSAAALDIIALIPVREGRDLLFGKGAGGFSGFSKAKDDLDKRAGITQPWRIHDLRRTCSTGMGESGVDPYVVEAVLNHVSGAKAGVAGTYNRAAYAAQKRDALDRWAAHVTKLCI